MGLPKSKSVGREILMHQSIEQLERVPKVLWGGCESHSFVVKIDLKVDRTQVMTKSWNILEIGHGPKAEWVSFPLSVTVD
jgi:hypothetical protein